MKRSFALLLSTLASCLTASLPASELTPEEQAFFDQHTPALVQFETERMYDVALEKVFSAPFYSLKILIPSLSSQQSTVVTRVGDKLAAVLPPSEDGDLPEFQKMISPEFKLRTDADGRAMQQALNVLFPPFVEREKKLLTFQHKGNVWTFVRGEFFDSKSGYVLETGPGGEIRTVKYLLRLP